MSAVIDSRKLPGHIGETTRNGNLSTVRSSVSSWAGVRLHGQTSGYHDITFVSRGFTTRICVALVENLTAASLA
jgi:hypothetical protein